jgi:hypothetical protein
VRARLGITTVAAAAVAASLLSPALAAAKAGGADPFVPGERAGGHGLVSVGLTSDTLPNRSSANWSPTLTSTPPTPY